MPRARSRTTPSSRVGPTATRRCIRNTRICGGANPRRRTSPCPPRRTRRPPPNERSAPCRPCCRTRSPWTSPRGRRYRPRPTRPRPTRGRSSYDTPPTRTRRDTTPRHRSASYAWSPSRSIPCSPPSTCIARLPGVPPRIPCRSCTHPPKSSARRNARRGTSPRASRTGRTRAGTPSPWTSDWPRTAGDCGMMPPSIRILPCSAKACTWRNDRRGRRCARAPRFRSDWCWIRGRGGRRS
mmetsp:Transcript_9622/g.23517  ORF Transcript_9622/g.23517 Transcript_9622/m.23517 type:complete len:239 (+) Transcript_9622:532-1248(+)